MSIMIRLGYYYNQSIIQCVKRMIASVQSSRFIIIVVTQYAADDSMRDVDNRFGAPPSQAQFNHACRQPVGLGLHDIIAEWSA